MEKLNYPLLYFQLKENAVLGILVGAGYQLVEKDLKTLQKAMSSHLQKNYKRYDEYPQMRMQNPKLKTIRIGIRPTYKDDFGSYPVNHTLQIPIVIVYGPTDQDHFECYLPLFKEAFHYYEANQLDPLVKYLANSVLNQMLPEQIYRLLTYPEPRLDFVSLRVNYKREFNWAGVSFQREYPRLEQLTEQFPYPKAVRKNTAYMPEAAWELEDKVEDVLSKVINSRANVLLVGSHGVGKTAVLQQAIKKISGLKKKQKLEYTFWRILPQRITATTKYLGEWQEICEELVYELQSANGILWVIDIIQLLQSGGEGPEDSVAAFLLAFLQQNQLQMIGEATPQELESMRRLLPGFVESFQIVKIEELPEKKIQSVLLQFTQSIQKQLDLRFNANALSLAYRLLLRYYPYESFPGKGIKFLGQCINDVQFRNVKTIDKKTVIQNFIKQTGLPELFLRDELLLDSEALYRYFSERIIGQIAAVNKLCGIVKIYKAGLNNPYKPISTLLFVGPTGVGKTASAQALANYFFGMGQKKSPLIRIDMSEFQHPAQIIRFIGSGKKVGQLVKDVRERPFAVLLLDEIEKADPSIFDALLTVLDEGLLVDAYGRTTNFRNTIIIMTSNLGASNRKSIGYVNSTSEEDNYLSAVNRHFRPEFVNRIDGVAVFTPLGEKDIRTIAKKELESLKQREGFVKRNIKIEFSEAVTDHLAQIGFDEKYGARPLQRALEQSLVTPLAHWLLAHSKARNCTLQVDFQGGLQVKMSKATGKK